MTTAVAVAGVCATGGDDADGKGPGCRPAAPIFAVHATHRPGKDGGPASIDSRLLTSIRRSRRPAALITRPLVTPAHRAGMSPWTADRSAAGDGRRVVADEDDVSPQPPTFGDTLGRVELDDRARGVVTGVELAAPHCTCVVGGVVSGNGSRWKGEAVSMVGRLSGAKFRAMILTEGRSRKLATRRPRGGRTAGLNDAGRRLGDGRRRDGSVVEGAGSWSGGRSDGLRAG